MSQDKGGENETLTFHSQGRVGADEHGDSTGTTGRATAALCVDSDVTANDNRVPSVPRRRLDPVDGVEEGRGGTVAGVLGVDTLDVGVARRLEEVHEHGLDRLGLVDDRLGTDVEATNRARVDIVLL